MKRKRYTLDIKKNQSFTLNITSMTDMFTILLVFLLQTFASAEVQIDAVKDLRLPSSISDKNPIQGVKLSLTHNQLSLDSTLLAELKSNEFNNETIDPNDSNFIKPLYAALEKINTVNKDKNEKLGKILFLADQDIPYSVLRKVMYTASMAGFPNLKLVTVAGN